MKVLIIAAHPDDEVMGVGGTIAKHAQQGDTIYLLIVTKAYTPEWSEEFIKNRPEEVAEVNKVLGIEKTFFLDLPTVKLDTISRKDLNDLITQVVYEVKPEVVYVTHKGDVNQDHRLVFEATMVAIRPKPGVSIKKVLSYETLSGTEWAAPFVENVFIPNVFVDISDNLELKLKAMAIYESEVKEYPHPRSLEAISVLAKRRGSTIGVKAAEAFMLIREEWI